MPRAEAGGEIWAAGGAGLEVAGLEVGGLGGAGRGVGAGCVPVAAGWLPGSARGTGVATEARGSGGSARAGRGLRLLRLLCELLVLLAWLALRCVASGPRYVAGPPYFTAPAGQPVVWRQPTLEYSTDPGDLSAGVTHAQADQVVADAAGVWNLPVASITVEKGGELAEDVSGQNVTVGAGGVAFPADVSRANAANVPVAVIYDRDGAVTDTLLGAGASAPGSCRQNAVTESVDGFDPAGYIVHALVIVNGRCAGAAPEQLLELRYKLERAFGRVLGLGWSQANDNVFTGVPQASYQQALHWPLMHPIDIVCGPYAYQCLPSPFVLRPDDVAGMVLLYPVGSGSAGAGKQWSLAAASEVSGNVSFPTGQGMRGVNVTVRRQYAGGNHATEAWVTGSAVTGTTFRRTDAPPFFAPDTTVAGSFGAQDPGGQGRYRVAWIPQLDRDPWQNLVVTTEAVNPLYARGYGLGPYAAGAVTPSGSAMSATVLAATPGTGSGADLVAADGASRCGLGDDGTSQMPAQAGATGWWRGLLCGYGHVAWAGADVRPGRTYTVEMTALDEQGLATLGKTMPVLALFGQADQWWDPPSVGRSAGAFGSLSLGTTGLRGATGNDTRVRVEFADQRGDGRPDFAYQARFFYADDVLPGHLPPAGGTMTVTGMGFRAGNTVKVNGVAAQVTGATANALTVTVPAMAAAGATAGTAVDVLVEDRATGASSTIAGGLTYQAGALPRVMRTVSVPAGNVFVGETAGSDFAVQVLAADAATPVAGERVSFEVRQGAATFTACGGAAACTVTTDTAGMAATAVVAAGAGAIALAAVDGALSQPAALTGVARAAAMQLVSAPQSPATAGVEAQGQLMVRVLDAGGNGMAGRAVTFTVRAGTASFTGCAAAVCTRTTDYAGYAAVAVTPMAAGVVQLEAADGSVRQTVSVTVTDNTDVLQVAQAPAATSYVGSSNGQFAIRLLHADGVSPDWYQRVTFTAPAGVNFLACGTNVCTLTTDTTGVAGSAVEADVPGSYTMVASFGSLSQQVAAAWVPHTLEVRLVTVPGQTAVGRQAAVPFAAQLLRDGTEPVTGTYVALAGVETDVYLNACGKATCFMPTDANGVVTTTVTPLRAGRILLNASSREVNAATSFVATGQAEVIRVVSGPGPAGVPVGVTQTVAAQVIGPDGVTPVAGKRVTFRVGSGNFGWVGCGYAACSPQTDGNGMVEMQGQAYAAGPVELVLDDVDATQVLDFTAYDRTDLLAVVSAPADGSYVGQVAGAPFALRLLAADGVTPVAGRDVVLTVTAGAAGAAGFVACGGAAQCVLRTDAGGRVASAVVPGAAGQVGLQAVSANLVARAGFRAVLQPQVLRVVALPAAVALAGDPAGGFTVRLLAADGVTPVAGQVVTFTATPGLGTMLPCGGASCGVVTGADGSARVDVTTVAAGSLVVTAVAGTATAQAAVRVLPKPDVVTVVSAPAAGAWVGETAAAVFAVRVLAGDGPAAGQPAAGRNVVLTAGSAARLEACGAGTCTLLTDAAGMVESAVTPLAAVRVQLAAADGAVVVTASFVAAVRPDTVVVESVPGAGSVVGVTAAMPFAVRVADGAGTAAAGRSVAVSVTGGSARLEACGAASCTLVTDAAGRVATAVTPLIAGAVGLSAVEGGVTVAAAFTAVTAPDRLALVSVPADGSEVGRISAAGFAVRLTLADGTPRAGVDVTLAAGAGQAGAGQALLTACGAARCVVRTDAAGVAASGVQPVAAGVVALTADGGTAVEATGSFWAAPAADVLRAGALPVSTWTFDAVAWTVTVLAADGVTPVAGRTVSFLSSGGQMTECGSPVCGGVTDTAGTVTVHLRATVAGAVSVTAAEGGGSVAGGYVTVDRPDALVGVTVPAGQVYVGEAAAFAVRVLGPDGVSPAAGRSVTFRVTAGAAALAACGGTSCTVMTDAAGMAVTDVAATAAGAVTVVAGEGSAQLVAVVSAVERPLLLTLESALAGGATAGEVLAQPLAVRVTEGDGVTPVAGVSVVFASGAVAGGGAAGTVLFGACGGVRCTGVTGPDGVASTGVTASGAGAVLLTATAAGQSVSMPLTVAAGARAVTAGQAEYFVAAGAQVALGLEASATENGLPAGGVALNWTADAGLAGVAGAMRADGNGAAWRPALAGPLAGGEEVTALGCAWQTLCAAFRVTGVGLGELQPVAVEGGAQAATAGAALNPVRVRVVGLAGEPVLGADVAVYQQVYAETACPDRGRCPGAPVLAEGVAVLTTDAAGEVQFVPLTVEGTATETRVALSAGTTGFAALVLTRKP